MAIDHCGNVVNSTKDKKYEITKEQILRMAEQCPTAKEVLRAGFPEAFEKEWGPWEDVTAKMRMNTSDGVLYLIIDREEDISLQYWPLKVENIKRESLSFAYLDGWDFKFEGGRIWRRKK